MKLMKSISPRWFNYRPRYYKPPSQDQEEPHRIKFRRITLYDPHSKANRPLTYMIVVILVAIIIFWLGGIRPSAQAPTLTTENVANE